MEEGDGLFRFARGTIDAPSDPGPGWHRLESRNRYPAYAVAKDRSAGREDRRWAIAIHTDWQHLEEEGRPGDWDPVRRRLRCREWESEWNGRYGYGPALMKLVSAQVEVIVETKQTHLH